jgi:hypothetical protein
MSGALATLLEPTLSQSVDTLVLLARGGSGGCCLWCGSPRLEVLADAAENDLVGETCTVVCQECGSELESTRSVTNRDRRR